MDLRPAKVALAGPIFLYMTVLSELPQTPAQEKTGAQPHRLSGEGVAFVVGDYALSRWIYEVTWSSVCPALLCDPRRNLVAPI